MTHNGLIDNHYFFWFLYSDRFFHAALRLEDLVRQGEKIWQEEMHKLPVKNEFSQFETTISFEDACRDRDCHHVYPYLYCHSLELLMKGIMIASSLQIQNKHSLCDLFDAIADKIKPLPAEEDSIKNMLKQLDGIYWAFRYPWPTVQRHKIDASKIDKKCEQLTLNCNGNKCRTNNMGLIFDQNKNIFIQLRKHILSHKEIKRILPK